jgi:hypothetical protein
MRLSLVGSDIGYSAAFLAIPSTVKMTKVSCLFGADIAASTDE